jgi:hypothetical protein
VRIAIFIIVKVSICLIIVSVASTSCQDQKQKRQYQKVLVTRVETWNTLIAEFYTQHNKLPTFEEFRTSFPFTVGTDDSTSPPLLLHYTPCDNNVYAIWAAGENGITKFNTENIDSTFNGNRSAIINAGGVYLDLKKGLAYTNYNTSKESSNIYPSFSFLLKNMDSDDFIGFYRIDHDQRLLETVINIDWIRQDKSIPK